MSYSHSDVADMWWCCGEAAKGSRMFTDGQTIYSFGTHFPIATKIKGTVLFNTDKYSSSTSKHQRIVLGTIGDTNIVICSTKEIIAALDNPKEPIIITKIQPLERFDEIMQCMRTHFKQKGVKRFPLKDIENYILKRMVAEAI